MKRLGIALTAAVVAAAAGCAALRSGERADPRAQLETGLHLLADQEFAAANDMLYPLYRRYWQQTLGQQALLALMAAEIDPRNPDRRLWSTADMAGRYLQIPGAPPWTEPVARSFYLLAIELGAAEERLARAEAERDEAERTARERQLPQLTGPTVPARLRQIENERDELRRRLEQMEQRLAQRERELREKEQELERIRRTVRG